MRTALIVVCAQADFIDGPMARHKPNQKNLLDGVRDLTPKILEKLTELIDEADITIFTKSIHEKDHPFDFLGEPRHCVKGTKGARLNSTLVDAAEFGYTTTNNIGPNETYSAFEGGTLRPKESVEEILQLEKITDVWVAGFGHPNEVSCTALDANALGYKTTVYLSATPGTGLGTVIQLRKAGVKFENDSDTSNTRANGHAEAQWQGGGGLVPDSSH